MSCEPIELFDAFFTELEHRGIEYVILHGYEHLPMGIEHDVDYAVPCAHLPHIPGILAKIARRHGWRLVATLRHGLTAYYSTLISLADPRHFLKLDACSHYARICRLLVPEQVLLTNRRRHGRYWAPAPAAEFIYEATKLFDAKKKNPADYLARLRALWEQDRAGAEAQFERAFGKTGRTLEQWLSSPPEDWRPLGRVLFSRNHYSWRGKLRELGRMWDRFRHPSGFVLGLLGPDGVGKTTALVGARALLEGCFRREDHFHFRPHVGQQTDGPPVTNPHGQPPRPGPLSTLKLLYYLADTWIGWLSRVRPAKVRSSFVIFDRTLADVAVDPRRYRIARAGWLARRLHRFAPQPDLVVVLDAPSEVIHARKPELSVAEIERQRTELRALAESHKNWSLISTHQPAGAVAAQLARLVADQMAGR